MTTLRLGLAAVGLVALCGGADAQQPSTFGAATPRPATTRGACIIVHNNGQQGCTPGMDAGGCNAVAMETHSKTTFKPGESCP